jgi:glucuronosyltransferase
MKLFLILPILCLASLSAFPKTANSAKILSVAFVSSKSHKITYEPLLHALAERGHEVTTLSPVKSSKPVKNLRDIITLDIEKQNDEMAKKWNAFEMKEKGEEINPFKMLEVFGSICEETYDLPQVHELLKEKFDLIIVSAIFNECAAGYIYKFNTSIIQVSPISAQSWILHPVGGSSPTSFVPNVFMGYGQEMNFMERAVNFVTEVVFVQVWNWFIVPRFEEIYRNKLGDQSLPGAFEILKNTSLIISNGHFSMNSPRPFLPDVIEVGGMHTRPAKKLPKVKLVGVGTGMSQHIMDILFTVPL